MKSGKVTHHPGYDGNNFSTVEDQLELKPAGPSPASSTDMALARWSGTGGRTLQNSGVIVDNSNDMAIPGKLTVGSASQGSETVDVNVGTQVTDGVKLIGSDTHFVFLAPSLGAAGFNPNTQAGDTALIYSAGGGGNTGNLVVAPWSSTSTGYRMDANGVLRLVSEGGFSPRATLTDAATIAWNAQNAQVAKVTLGGNRTLGAPTNLVDGFTYVLFVSQDGTGSRTLAYNAVFKWPNGVAFVLSTAVNALDIITFVSDGTNMYGVGQKAFA
jgi:hypothetical protein